MASRRVVMRNIGAKEHRNTGSRNARTEEQRNKLCHIDGGHVSGVTACRNEEHRNKAGTHCLKPILWASVSNSKETHIVEI